MKDQLQKTFKERQKKYYGKILALSLCVGAIILVVVFLQWLFEQAYIGFTIFVAFPLVIIPLFVCAIIATTRICHEPEYNFRTFYAFYPVGMSSQLRGSFRVLVTFFKSLLIMLAINIVGFAIVYSLPYYQAIINDFIVQIDGMSVLNMSNKVQEFLYNGPMYLPYTILVSSSFGGGFIYFIYSILSRMLYVNCKINAMLPNGRNMPIFKEVFAKYRKTYYMALLKYNWMYFVFPILGFILSVVLSFVLHFEVYGVLIGVLVTILLLIPTTPNLLLLNDIMFEVMGMELQVKNSSYITEMLSKVGGQSNLSEEQKKELDKMINDLVNKKNDVIDGDFEEHHSEDNKDSKE